MIKISDLHKSYNNNEILKGINLNINEGELVSIVGASGAGKTTLLNLIGTLDKPDKGSISVQGININKLSENALSEFRNKQIGFVFQFHNLLPEFNVYENIAIPALINGNTHIQIKKDIEELLNLLNISDKIWRKPSELSGGEKQRVAVARALINNPSVVLADEPSGNLDSVNANDLHNLFFMLREKFKKTFIIVTHNDEFANMTDRKIIIKDGLVNV